MTAKRLVSCWEKCLDELRVIDSLGHIVAGGSAT